MIVSSFNKDPSLDFTALSDNPAEQVQATILYIFIGCENIIKQQWVFFTARCRIEGNAVEFDVVS